MSQLRGPTPHRVKNFLEARFGMRGAYEETLATAIKRKHEPQRFVGDLLSAEISEKQARSIKYQLTVAKLPLAKDVDDFTFKSTPINEALVHDLVGGGFIAQQRNVVLVGGTGTGKTHLAIAIARSCIRAGSRGRFFTTVDLVNQLEAESSSLYRAKADCRRGDRRPVNLSAGRLRKGSSSTPCFRQICAPPRSGEYGGHGQPRQS
jgi:DNA replication protein DnaC